LNVTGNAGYADALKQAGFLAKRGVNMVRVHGTKKSLFTGDTLTNASPTVIDQMHAVVAAMKQEGIYTFVSNTFFVIEMQVKASYGMAGYTSQRIAANPDQLVPFGLIILDDTLRNAYKGWLTALMTTANLYEPNQTPLAAGRRASARR